MSSSIVAAIGRAWRSPRGEMARLVSEGLSEPRALFHLMLASGLFFLAGLPDAIRTSHRIDIDDPVSGAVTAYLFAYVFVAPLLFYALAAFLHFVARIYGGAGGFLGARSALFWTLLVGAPLAIGLSLTGVMLEVMAGPGAQAIVKYAGYVVLVFWIWLLASALAEAEGIAKSGKVAVTLVLIFILLAAIVALLTRDAGAV